MDFTTALTKKKEHFNASQCMSLSKYDTQQNQKKTLKKQEINKKPISDESYGGLSYHREDTDAEGSLTSVGSEDVFEMFDAIGLEEHQQD